MTYATAQYLLARYPRSTRAVVAACSAVAAAISLLIPEPIPEKLLGALFYGVIAWLATAAVHDLIFGARLGGPTRFPLPGMWRMRTTDDDGRWPTVVMPLHLDPDDNDAARTFALGFVFFAIGAYLLIGGRHDPHTGVKIVAVCICFLLALPCLVTTAPRLYRHAAHKHALALDPEGIGLVDGPVLAWTNVAHVDVTREPVRIHHGRKGAMRTYLTIVARESHSGMVRVDITGISNPRGVLAVINAYLHDPTARTALGTRASLWHVRRLRHTRPKMPVRLTPAGTSRIEQ
jgi:hypothetical protein